jgi:hypothetical protein
LEVLERKNDSASMSYRLRLRSARDAPEPTVSFSRNSSIRAASIVGQASQAITVPLDELSDQWMKLTCHTVQLQGLELIANILNRIPVDIWIVDRSFVLLEAGTFFRKADGGMTVPFQDGDAAMATRHIRLFDVVR